MLSPKKGLAYILNNKEFTGYFERRNGSDVDYKNMIHLFNQLRYEVYHYTDLNAKVLDMVFFFYFTNAVTFRK